MYPVQYESEDCDNRVAIPSSMIVDRERLAMGGLVALLLSLPLWSLAGLIWLALR
jgi:hypothetical protein